MFAQAAASLVFMGVILMLDIFPAKYLALLGAALVFLWSLTLNLQMVRRRTKAFGKVLSILLVAALSLGSYYVLKANDTLGMIADDNPEEEVDEKITKEPFTVYISGIDVMHDPSSGKLVNSEGESGQERSDVNILAVVNPQTRQILLVTTPRDYYVVIPGISEGMSDKLTHAGLYGVDASMDTLAALYETEIKYYARMNFNALIEIVDTLGGVDVYSECEFTTGYESSGNDTFTVTKGYNHLNGARALAFSRERNNLPEGDFQRGRNQQAVITAMMRKMLSPAMLLKAGSVMSSVGENAETNLSRAQINGLIKYQLDNGAKWSVKSIAAEGIPEDNYCYSLEGVANVVVPDEESVQSIIGEINLVEEGGTLEGAQALE